MLPDTLSGRLDELLDRLTRTAAAANRKRPRRGHGDSYMCCCPAHDDKNPSLSVTLEGDRILLNCFAGCSFEDIAEAVGMPREAMFADYHGEPGCRPAIRWNGSSRVATAAVDVPRGTVPLPLPPAVPEFTALEFPPVDPLLGPWTTQMLCIVHAPPGAGKTMLALQLGWALSSGQAFGGWASHRAARVLLVDGEMAGQTMQRRLQAAPACPDFHIANLANWAAENDYEPLNLAEQAGQDVVNVWANGLGAEVLILDNLMSLAWVDGVSMNSDEFWQPVRRFAVQQRAYGRLVIVMDHSNQSGQIHGTKTKLWHADLAVKLELKRVESDLPPGFDLPVDNPEITVSFPKVRGTPDFASHDTADRVLSLGAVGQNWSFKMGREHQRQQAREMAGNDLSIRDIAEELGVPKSTVARWLK